MNIPLGVPVFSFKLSADFFDNLTKNERPYFPDILLLFFFFF